MLKKQNVIEFLEKNITDNEANKTSLLKLKSAYNNLCSEKVIISLSLHNLDNKVFNEEEWFEIILKPLSLAKSGIFKAPFTLQAIKKDTYLYWSINNITANKNMEDIFLQERTYLRDFIDYDRNRVV